MKRLLALLMAVAMTLALTACANDNGQSSQNPSEPSSQAPVSEPPATQPAEGETQPLEAAEIQVFIAASLENAFQDIIALYNQRQPNVTGAYSAEASGTLLSQIQEGFACDIFFSAGAKQINQLQEAGLDIEGTRVDLLQNKVALITYKDSGTSVTTLSEIGNASSVALAGNSVPVGQYTAPPSRPVGFWTTARTPLSSPPKKCQRLWVVWRSTRPPMSPPP